MRLLILFIIFSINATAQKSIFFAQNKNPATAGSTAFITTPSGSSTPHAGFNGWVGCGFTVGGSNITVTDLGRWVISGNSASHDLTIMDGSGAILVTATINTSGLSVGYNYVSCTPTVLTAGNTYYIMSLETSGGDQFYDIGTVTSTAAGTIITSNYAFFGGPPLTASSGSVSYVPVNFKYYL